VQLSDGAVVVAQLPGAALLAAVGGRALQVAEHHIEDVDHIVAGAGGEREMGYPFHCQPTPCPPATPDQVKLAAAVSVPTGR
jgi:hypothetical protein